MRTLRVALTLLATTASASGTLVNTELSVAPSAVELLPSSKVRLGDAPRREAEATPPGPKLPPTPARVREIDGELRGLEVRLGGGQVFLQTAQLLTPWFLVGAAPLMVLGVGLGYTKSDGSDPGVTRSAFAAVGVLGAVAASLLVVCVFRVVDHWVDEASSARERNERIRQLRTERQALVPSG